MVTQRLVTHVPRASNKAVRNAVVLSKHNVLNVMKTTTLLMVNASKSKAL